MSSIYIIVFFFLTINGKSFKILENPLENYVQTEPDVGYSFSKGLNLGWRYTLRNGQLVVGKQRNLLFFIS